MVASGFCEAHEPITTKLTWTREISRIFYKRCIGCHREGGRAPMSLVIYEEARPWAKAIKEEVLERRMPPWGAVKGFGEFRNDTSLSEREIELIAEWVEGGAPKGEDVYLPPTPNLAPKEEPPMAPLQRLPVSDGVPLKRDLVAVGVLPSEAPMQVTAQLPDGTVQPLVWVRDRRPEGPAAYYFREPLRLPKGARIRVGTPIAQKQSSSVVLLVRTR